MRCNIYTYEHPRVGYFLRKYIATNSPQGVFADSLYPYHQQNQLVLVCKMVQIAIPTVETRNIILWNYVESGTINRPLRLRNQLGKIYKQTTTCGLFIIQNVWQQTFRNIHFLRKYMAANTPQGVFADLSRPHHNQKQLVLVCKMVRIAIPTVEIRNTISGRFVESGTINRPLRLRNQRGKIQQRIHHKAYLPIHRAHIINKTNWV